MKNWKTGKRGEDRGFFRWKTQVKRETLLFFAFYSFSGRKFRGQTLQIVPRTVTDLCLWRGIFETLRGDFWDLTRGILRPLEGNFETYQGEFWDPWRAKNRFRPHNNLKMTQKSKGWNSYGRAIVFDTSVCRLVWRQEELVTFVMWAMGNRTYTRLVLSFVMSSSQKERRTCDCRN